MSTVADCFDLWGDYEVNPRLPHSVVTEESCRFTRAGLLVVRAPCFAHG